MWCRLAIGVRFTDSPIMEITPIRTEKDYRAALRVVSALVDQDPSPVSHEGERLEVLSTLIEAYERKHHAIDSPDKGGTT